MPNLRIPAWAALLLAAGSTASAAETEEAGGLPKDLVDGTVHVSDSAPIQSPLGIRTHATFRLRPELLLGGDLGPGSSPVRVPLEAKPQGPDPEAMTLAWASMRLRFAPVLEIAQIADIHLSVDALDNLVLGTTHANAGGDFARGLWEDSQASPSAGINGWADAFKVRELYGHLRIIELLDFSAGRMARHFGLGLIRNRGDCADCDFGSIVDGAHAALSISGVRLEFLWEFSALGAQSHLPGWERLAYDLGQEDDVSTYTVQVGMEPRTQEELSERQKLLDEERGVAFDWGVLAMFTDQPFSSSEQPDPEPGCEPLGETTNGFDALPYRCYQLIPRDGFFFRPSLWARLLFHPDAMTELRIEAEAGLMYANIKNLQRSPELGDTSKTFLGGGGALELELRYGSWRTGLDFGFATGDDRDFLGYLDGQNIVEADDGLYLDPDNTNVRENAEVTSFWFNRDYRLDLILFRQVLGGVTNAIYTKPWVAYDFLATDEVGLTARLDVLYAAAADPHGTPGAKEARAIGLDEPRTHYGLEVDGHLVLSFPAGFEATLSAGVLIPFDALNGPGDLAPEPAFALRGLLGWRY
jgi:uncharacterized protein (TIGR04551 family)